eukprot:2900684-Rhodomonas_salina.1
MVHDNSPKAVPPENPPVWHTTRMEHTTRKREEVGLLCLSRLVRAAMCSPDLYLGPDVCVSPHRDIRDSPARCSCFPTELSGTDLALCPYRPTCLLGDV